MTTTERHTLEGIYGHIEAAIHRTGPSTELLDARNGLAVYMARPKPMRKARKQNGSIVGRMSEFDKANIARLAKVKFPSKAATTGARFARPDDVNTYLEHNGQRIYTNDPAGAKAARDYLKALRAA